MDCCGGGCCENQTRDIQADWEFWKEIVLNIDGSINLEQVKKELSDYLFIARQASKVYNHITGGRISNPMTPSAGVIEAYKDHLDQIQVDNET